jgi:riboflavin synthase
MFTGLVEDMGTVARADRRPRVIDPSDPASGPEDSEALVLAIRPGHMPLAELAVGESICHDGACLTVTSVERDAYTVLAGAETLARTTLGQLRVGKRVNLERALRTGDRLGGHFVTGHVDATGELAGRRDLGANLVLVVRAPRELLRLVVEKGSIAIAGVSLTVNAVDAETLSVAIIPHTREMTTLGELAIGDRVNLETDLLAKHVAKLVENRP